MNLQPQEVESAGGFFSWWQSFWQRPEPQPPEEEEEGDVRVAGWADPLHPATLADVVGQERLVRLLTAEAAQSKVHERPLPHTLFYGPPGVGKSMLAETSAKDAGHEVYLLSGPEWQTQVDVLQSLDRVAELHQKTGKPVAIVLDEVDGISRVASYALHAFMTRGVVFWKGHELYRGLPVCILASCNTLARTPAALRSRFRDTLHVDYQDTAGLAEIARRMSVRLGVELAEEASQFLGSNAAGEPRRVLHLLRLAADFAQDGTITLEIARTALALSGLHARGLDERQHDYLTFLAEQENGTAGVSTLAGYLATDQREISEAVEPFLIRAKLASVTSKGRRITDAGRGLLS